MSQNWVQITEKVAHRARLVGWEAGWRLGAKAFVEQVEAVGVPVVCPQEAPSSKIHDFLPPKIEPNSLCG